MSPAISAAQKKQIIELSAKGLSSRQVAHKLNIEHTSVLKFRGRRDPASKEAVVERIRKGAVSLEELGAMMGISSGAARKRVLELKNSGVLLHEGAGGIIEPISAAIAPAADRLTVRGHTGEPWTHVFGVTSDNHLCNKHSRLDVLRVAYDHFEREGITHVLNAGNWIDGEARFNKTELVTAPGMDNQINYLLDKWPARKGITTHFIAGDDHEGWYSQREGIEIGKYLELQARQQGRSDLHYLGYAEADIQLAARHGSSVLRLVHPGGGSAYAISYTDQKRLESYQGGEKPAVEVVGHYHKFNQGYPREVHTVQCGCTCDQTLFMRKKRLQAHVGFVVLRLRQNSAGIVERCAVEWFPFFDRGFYEKRFA